MFEQQISSLLSFLVGCGCGVSVGIASGTAESFMIPFVTIMLAQSVYQAIGTSLLVDCIIGGVAGIMFLKKGNMNVRPVVLLAVSGMVASVLGSMFTKGTPESGLKFLIAFVLIGLGVALLRGGIRKNVEYVNSKVSFGWFQRQKFVSLIFFGSLIGFASGFTGMGSSGAMTFVLIFIMGYDLHTSIGTSLMMMFFIAGSGAITHGLRGEILPTVALFAGLGALVGATSGSFFANRIDEEKLGRLIGLIITILGLSVLIELLI
ncbi:MAG: sulfite exporter TauE/SafE family protein [Thermoplasmatota archaeon]